MSGSPGDSFTLYPKAKSLLSESPLLTARTGPGGDDLSLSELSLGGMETPVKAPPPRFSLFGAGAADSPQQAQDEPDIPEDDQTEVIPDRSVSQAQQSFDPGPLTEDDLTTNHDDYNRATPPRVKSPSDAPAVRRSREEELQSALFQMKKINAVLLDYVEALHATEARNKVLAHQVENSHQLLNKYTAVLSQTEHTARLLLDPEWKGAEADEERAIELAEQQRLERERLAREEQERLERLERERIAREAEEQRQREVKEKSKMALSQTNLVQIDETHAAFSIPNAGAVGHIVVFLLGTITFPAGYAATIHLEWPGKGFQLLGMLSNDKPSAIFKLRGTAADNQADATALVIPGSGITATLGISIESIEAVQAQVAALHPPSNTSADLVSRMTSNPTFLAERIVKHLFNHLSSFEMNVGPQTVVPLGVIQKWYDGLLSKLRAGGVGFLARED